MNLVVLAVKCAFCLNFFPNIWYISYSTVLDDTDILSISERITNDEELLKLGVRVLKWPDFKIKTALFDHKDSITVAAYQVLSEWHLKFEQPHEAYDILLSGLQRENMMHLLNSDQDSKLGMTASLTKEREFTLRVWGILLQGRNQISIYVRAQNQKMNSKINKT